AGQKEEVNNPREFLRIIQSAKEKILQDKTLQGLFDKIDKKISNTQLRDFRDYLFVNQDIVTELSDLDKFKQKLWISYISNNLDEYRSLIEEYKKGQTKIKGIINKAKTQKTDWENVIEIFNSRFYVPYRIRIQNKEDSILKDVAPNI